MQKPYAFLGEIEQEFARRERDLNALYEGMIDAMRIGYESSKERLMSRYNSHFETLHEEYRLAVKEFNATNKAAGGEERSNDAQPQA